MDFKGYKSIFLLTLWALAGLLNPGIAQNEKQIDSIEQVIARAQGEAKIEAMEALFDLIFLKQPDEAFELAREIEQLSLENGLELKVLGAWWKQAKIYQIKSNYDSLRILTLRGIAEAKKLKLETPLSDFYNFMGIYHEKAGSVDSALYYYESALKLEGAKKLMLFSNIGLAYQRKGEPVKSIEYLERAMQEAQEKGKIEVQAIVANNIGNAHNDVGNLDKAQEYFEKSLELKEQIGDQRGKLFAIYNLVNMKRPLEFKKKYLEMGLEIAREVNNLYFLRILQAKKALILNQEGQHQEALDLGLQLYNQAEQGVGTDMILILRVLVESSGSLGRPEESEKYALEMYEMARKTNSFGQMQSARLMLLKSYAAQNKYKEAFEISKKYYPARDSIRDLEALESLTVLDNKLKNVEQEKEIAQLNNTLRQREIRRNWIIGVALLLAITLSLILYFRSRQVNIQKKMIKQEQEAARELETMNKELKSLDELKSRFFTNISHELRTPVTLILTPVEQLLKKYAQKLDSEMEKPLQTVRNNSKKLLALVEELLELSRIDAGKIEVNTSPTQLYTFTRQLFYAYESGAAFKQIDFQFHYDLDKELWVYADQNKLEKVVNNLLSNALKFTPNGGRVRLKVSLHTMADQHLLVEVSDTGRGIPPEDLPFVFDRYFQTKNNDLPTEGGTGIGLALSRELAGLMGGSLDVASEWGKGSQFTLRFPLEVVPTKDLDLETPETASEPSVEEETTFMPLPIGIPTGTTGRPKVLIVEDNPDMQQLLNSLLLEDYECVIANNGAEAWDRLKNGDSSVADINLIISDVMMPQMDGYELLKRLKKDERLQHYPVIMLTARAAEDDKLQALRMGVDDYLTKPFSSEELLARAANLIHNRQQRIAFNESSGHRKVDIEFEEVSSAGQVWLKELEEASLAAIEQKLDLSVSYLADKMAISERQLLRQIKSLTGLSTKDYIQEIKLEKARHLLENKAYRTISEVSYASGFNTPGYFSKVFEKRFGKRPGEYLNRSTISG